ncbi:MAG: hypothetical protein ACPL07_02135, partial [Candidatus Bathyarchaeia archaeon]
MMEVEVPPEFNGLLRRLKVFQRNRKAFETKAFALIDVLEKSTYRATARKLSRFLEPVSKSAVWYWVKRFRERLRLAGRRRFRPFMALDETCLKSRGERLWVRAAVDPVSGETLALEAS